jgi:dihydroflavonol-4-reductase
MKVLVTGGTGFIGLPLVRELLARGDQVTLLVRDVERAKRIVVRELETGRLQLLPGDVLDPGSVVRAMSGVSIVFHLAGMISYKNADRRKVWRVNVEGTRNVVEAALAAGVSKFIHTSSIVAVGLSWDPKVILDESASYDAAGLRLEYFDAKHEAEAVVLAAVKRGLNAVIVNPGTVAGDPDYAGPSGNVSAAVKMMVNSPVLLPGGNAWVDVRDVVGGHLLALEKGRVGERYILAVENITNAEIAIRLSKGRYKPRIRLPSWLLRLVKTQLATRVSGFYLFFDCGKARRELGWNPRSPWAAIEKSN